MIAWRLDSHRRSISEFYHKNVAVGASAETMTNYVNNENLKSSLERA